MQETDRDSRGGKIVSTEVLIVGFGFSVIPLIRELERDGINYIVVSSGEGSIWDKLERNGRLDFDLVSSTLSSLYSFELVGRDTKDRYPTAREYLAFIRAYQRKYNSNVLTDWVTSVENYSSKSVVRTRSGRILETRYLIIATAFKRRMNEVLNEFDYASAKNKTIAFTAMGDSVNLMISKLIPYDNHIILISNGFVALDKLVFYGGLAYTLDQLEYHNIRHLSYLLYRKTFFADFTFAPLFHKLFSLLPINHFYLKHPLATRHVRRKLSLKYFAPNSPVPNGLIAIKYWSIDSYQELFDNAGLKNSIGDGYLLNDIAFFVEQGLVELWPKQETAIDRGQGTIRWRGKVVRYDQIVDAGPEVPNLPEISVGEGPLRAKYHYACRDSFMGIVPSELSNVYLIGLVRPTSGGLNNITEMQCLFTHKMITDPAFNREIYENIGRRIQRYNRRYYSSAERGPTDHLVHYGFYTDDLARLMKINTRVADCRSLRDLMIHFIFPNTAFKFRQTGSYKVDGVKQMVQHIYENHKRFSIVRNYLLNYALLQSTCYVAVIAGYYRNLFPALAMPLFLLMVMFNPVTPLIAGLFGRNSKANLLMNSLVQILMIAGLGLTALYRRALIPISVVLLSIVLSFAFYRLGWIRVPFNDLNDKKGAKYQEFFKRYCTAFREVFSKRAQQRAEAFQNARPAPERASPDARHVAGI
jgi:hypothetical protein